MPSLTSMRQLDPAGDQFQPLGPAIQPPTKPTPPLQPTGTPGVFKQPDGKLVTGLPLPPVARVHDSWVFPSYTRADFGQELLVDLAAMELRATARKPWVPSPKQNRAVQRAAHLARVSGVQPNGRAWTACDPTVLKPPPTAKELLLRSGDVVRASSGNWPHLSGLSQPDVVAWR